MMTMRMRTVVHTKIISVKAKVQLGGQGLVPLSLWYVMQEQKLRCLGYGHISRQCQLIVPMCFAISVVHKCSVP
jgi:hypothetical protein